MQIISLILLSILIVSCRPWNRWPRKFYYKLPHHTKSISIDNSKSLEKKIINWNTEYLSIYFSHIDFVKYKYGNRIKSDEIKSQIKVINEIPRDTIRADSLDLSIFYTRGTARAICEIINDNKAHVYNASKNEDVEILQYHYEDSLTQSGCGPGWALFHQGNYLIGWKYELCPY